MVIVYRFVGYVHAVLATGIGQKGSLRRHIHWHRQGRAVGQLSHTNFSDMESQFGRKCSMLICIYGVSSCSRFVAQINSRKLWCVNFYFILCLSGCLCIIVCHHHQPHPHPLIAIERDFRGTTHSAVPLHRMAFTHVPFLKCGAGISETCAGCRWARDRCEQRRWTDAGALQVSFIVYGV